MSEEESDILIESDIDDGRNYIWGRPCIAIPQNEENYSRYGGPMPWPPLPCVNWGFPEITFDKETLIEKRIQGLIMFHYEKIIVVRQLWALENWAKWIKECEEKGIQPEDHLRIYDTHKKLRSAIQEMITINLGQRNYEINLPNFKCWSVYLSKRSINPPVKGKSVRNNVIMLHVDKQHSLRDKYV